MIVLIKENLMPIYKHVFNILLVLNVEVSVF